MANKINGGQPHKFSVPNKIVVDSKRYKAIIEISFALTLLVAVLFGTTGNTSNPIFQLALAALFLLFIGWVMVTPFSDAS